MDLMKVLSEVLIFSIFRASKLLKECRQSYHQSVDSEFSGMLCIGEFFFYYIFIIFYNEAKNKVNNY